MFNFNVTSLNKLVKNLYTISDLENLSGIKAHTLRIWEQRYSLFNPQRSQGNIRHYTDEDLKKLLNVTTLQRNGMAISKIGKLSKEELHHKLKEIYEEPSENVHTHEDLQNAFLVACMDMNEEAFHKHFTTSIELLGQDALFLDVLFPVLEKIGLLWNTSEIIPAQEHFIIALLKQKVSSLTDSLNWSPVPTKKVLLFTPETEFHDIGLMLMNLMLRKKGIHTVYLGQSVPSNNIQRSIEITKADALIISVTIITNIKDFNAYLQQLANLCNPTHIYLLCPKQVAPLLTLPKSVSIVKKPFELYKHLILTPTA